MVKTEKVAIIMSLILEACLAGPYDAEKTSLIMYNTLLNDLRLKGYWTSLIEHGLLDYDYTTEKFKTTEKGLRFLKAFSELDQDIKRRKKK